MNCCFVGSSLFSSQNNENRKVNKNEQAENVTNYGCLLWLLRNNTCDKKKEKSLTFIDFTKFILFIICYEKKRKTNKN